MVAASSQDVLRRALVGIAVQIQGTDYSEVAHETGAAFLLLPPSPLANVLTLYFTSVGQSKARQLIVTFLLLYTPPRPHVLVFACRSIKVLQKCCWK
jgi:hypothetical protein